MSRLSLYVKTYIFRFFQTIGRYCDLYLSTPLPLSPTRTLKIDSTIGSSPGKFKVLLYTTTSYESQAQFSDHQRKKYPLLINLHGGGYTIGHAADDARWATAVLNTTECIVASVDYRLAPAHPFPTGIEDCVSAILYLWANADQLGIDISRTSISGFSAGANFAFTVSYRLHEELRRLKSEDRLASVEVGEVVSLVTFYPPVDWTQSREQRAASNPNFAPMIPPFMVGVMEASYLYPEPEDRGHHLISPGLAGDELVSNALPKDICIITCWADGLLGEAEVWRRRLSHSGKRVSGYVVDGVPHGWDKWPSWRRGNVKRDEAYDYAARSLKAVWDGSGDEES